MKEKLERYAPWIVLVGAAALIVLAFSIYEGYFYVKKTGWDMWLPSEYVVLFFQYTMLVVGVALIGVAVVLFRKLPLIESIKPVSVVLFFGTCIGFSYVWPLWIVSTGLCIYYLRHPERTNGKRGAVIGMLVLSLLGLFFIAQYVIRNGFGEMITLFGMSIA